MNRKYAAANHERRALKGLMNKYPKPRFRYEETLGVRRMFYRWEDGSGEIVFACEPSWSEMAAKLYCPEAPHA